MNGPSQNYLVPQFQNESSSKQNLSYDNEFDLHENEHAGKTQFHMNGFTQRLLFTQR